MENYSNYSYPDSRDSSPRSREIDSENPSSWDELPSNYKVKFMCSYGGKIQPRSHDNQLAYIGGDTKILAVDRNIKLSAFISKLSSLCGDADVCFKYQLPGEDLDALISVTNDEDLEHMMLEYDRLYRASAKPARLRLFLFPPQAPTSFGSNETKSERQWFVDALNSAQIQSLEGSSPPAVSVASAQNNPDFLFGFDKGYSAVPCGKFPDSVPPSTVPDSVTKDVSAGSDCGSEDRHLVGGEPVMSLTEIQRQIQDLQRMQIAGGHEQNLFHRKYDEVGNPKAYAGDYYSQNYPEKLAPNPSPVQMPVQVPIPATYLPERHMTTGGYSVSGAPTGTEQQFYFIPTPTGVYQAPASLRPVTGPISQGYYGVQRLAPEVYREAHMFNPAMVPQQPNVGNYMEGIQMPAQQTKIEVAYDSTGRQQVYYTTPGGAVSSYQTVTPVPVDGRQGGGGTLNQDGKVVGKASQ